MNRYFLQKSSAATRRENMFDGFLKECKAAVRSATYVLFCIALILMFVLQYRVEVNSDLTQARKGILFEETKWGGTHNNLLVEPTPDMASYGAADEEVPDQVMKHMTYRLYRDVAGNRYEVYHLGLIHSYDSLKFPKQLKLLDIFEKITGQPLADLDAEFYKMDMNKILIDHPDITQKEAQDIQRAYYKQLKYEFTPNKSVTKYFKYEDYIHVRQDLTYGEFKKLIAEAKKVAWGQSDVYTDFAQYGAAPYTYEEALQLHETMVEKDHVSGAYARLFCDRMGILAGILPALIAWAIAVGGLLKSSRHKPESTLYGLGASHLWTRFFAMSTMSFLPILILAIAAAVELGVGLQPLGLSMNPLVFVTYSFGWLLPTVMFTIAVALFFFVLTQGSAGIFVQIGIWYLSLLRWTGHGLDPIKYGMNLFLRHGIVGEYDAYASSMGVIIANRLAYLAAAFGLILAANYYLQRNADHPISFRFRGHAGTK
jgi:hypothetical protein